MVDERVISTTRPTLVRWRICGLIALASFVAYLLRTNMSVAGAPMAADLGLSPVQLGIVLGSFSWGYALLQFPGGVFGELLGARRALALLAIVWGVLDALATGTLFAVAGAVIWMFTAADRSMAEAADAASGRSRVAGVVA